ITTIQGKSSIAEGHPCSLGDMNSPAGQAAYPLADTVFAVGCRFGQTDIRWPWFTPPPRLIHLDADQSEIGRLYPAEVSLIGDTRTVLKQILSILSAGDSAHDHTPSRTQSLSPSQPLTLSPPHPLTPAPPRSSGWTSHLEELRWKHQERERM